MHNFAGAKHVFEKFHLLFVQCLLLIVSLCAKYTCVYLRMVVWKVWKVYLCILTDGSLELLQEVQSRGALQVTRNLLQVLIGHFRQLRKLQTHR